MKNYFRGGRREPGRPSFIMGEVRDYRPEHPYTAHSIAEFIGWYVPSYTSNDEDHLDGAHPYIGQTIAEFIGWLEPGRLIVLLTLFKEAINRFIKRLIDL